MANQDFTRTPGKGKFAYLGINLVRPPDLMPPGRAPFLLNVSPDQETGAMNPRSGTEQFLSRISNNPSPIHSYVAVGSDILTDQQPIMRWFGWKDQLWSLGQGSATAEVSGFSGNPFSFVPYRPPQSPSTWLYVFDSLKQVKFAPPYGSTANFQQNIGIFPPIAAPTTELAAPLKVSILDAATTLGWVSTGVAGPVFLHERLPDPTTIGAILYDTGTTGWCCVAPTNPQGDYSFIGTGMYIVLDTEVCPLMQSLPSLALSTVAGVAYDSGTSGLATLQATTPLQGLQRNALIVVNGSVSRVLSATQGPDGFYSVRCVLPAGITSGQTIEVPASFRAYSTLTHAIGDRLSSQTQMSIFTVVGATSAIGTIYNNILSYDVTQVEGRPLTNEDYIHFSFSADIIANVQEVHFMLDVDPVQNDFTRNYYYYVARQNDFQQTADGNATSTQSQLQAISTSIANVQLVQTLDSLLSLTQGTNAQGLPYPAASLPSSSTPLTGQLSAGQSQYFEAIIKVSDLVRVGTDTSTGLNNVKAVGLMAIVTGNVTIQVGSGWVGGAYGPDSNYNSYGNQGYPIQYRFRYRSSLTGAMSDVSPATRSGEVPLRAGINVSVIASPDTQVDLIDIERWGGTFNSWHRCMIVPNVTGTYMDTVNETTAMAGAPLELLQYQPWPITGKPLYGSCNIVGTRVTINPTNSIYRFNTKWIRGNEIIVNNQTYTLYAPPANDTTLETAENIGVFSNVPYIIPEATAIGQCLPYVAGPWDGRLWATGDTLNPGLLYFTNPYNPDTASDQGYIEITGPNEPLGMPVVFEGALYVFSTAGLFRVEATPGQANPYAAYRLGSVPSGLVAPWFVLRDANSPFLAWGGNDGIYVYLGSGGAENITKDDLEPLFPFESRPGLAVTVAGHTLYPPDLSQAGRQTQLRLSFADSQLFFDYVDIQGNARTLVFNPATKGWIPYEYVYGASLHYQEQGSLTAPIANWVNSPFTIVCGADGGLYYPDGSFIDHAPFLPSTTFPCVVITPADDQGDTRARKQYGDLMLDLGGAANVLPAVPLWQRQMGNLTPVSPGSNLLITVALPVGTVVNAFYIHANERFFATPASGTITWNIVVPRDQTYTVTVPIGNLVGPTPVYLRQSLVIQSGDQINVVFVSFSAPQVPFGVPWANIGNFPGLQFAT